MAIENEVYADGVYQIHMLEQTIRLDFMRLQPSPDPNPSSASSSRPKGSSAPTRPWVRLSTSLRSSASSAATPILPPIPLPPSKALSRPYKGSTRDPIRVDLRPL